MKQLFLSLLLMACTIAGFSQSPFWQWAKVDTGINTANNNSYRRQVVAASSNSILWATSQNGKYNATPMYYGDYKLTEYNTAGNVLGSTMITGKAGILDIKADAAGNWYILGKYNDSLQYGSLLNVKSNLTAPYCFLMRVNAGTLNMQWYEPIGVNYYANVSAICIRGNNVYVPVDSYLTTTVYKVDIATGSRTAMVKQVKTGYVSSVAADDNGNIYVAGSCPSFGVDSFGNKALTFGSNYNAYIIRYKADGSYDWSIFMNDITCTHRMLNMGNSNTLYYTGGLHDSLTIGNIKINKPSSLAGGNYIAASIDSTGSIRWVRQAKDTTAGRADMENLYNAAVIDSGLVVGMGIRNYVDWGNGITVNTAQQSASAYVMYSAAGVPKWMRRTYSDLTVPQFIAANNTDVWVTGMVRDSSSLDLDTVTVPVKPLTYLPYMAKLSVTGCMPPTLTVTNTGNGIYIVSWSAVPGSSRYEYVVSLNPPPYTALTTTNTTSLNISGLQGNARFYICIRTVCTDGSISDYACDTFSTTPTGITAFNQRQTGTSVYPNPAKQSISIMGMNKTEGAATVKISGITGSIVYQRTVSNPSANETIDVSNYARGMYYIEVQTFAGKSVEKLVLE